MNIMFNKLEITENLKFGLLDIIILKLILNENMYGYQIMQSMLEKSDNKLEIKEGSLYGPLYRLEKKELISSEKVIVGKKRYRIYYHITDLGKEYLECAIEAFNDVFVGANKIFNSGDEKNEKEIKKVL